MKQYTKADCGETVSLSEMKEHLLSMICALADFCEKNGIRYYLSGGTLLGAVRHKGFIPWDDDIDVNIPRPDCEKLQKMCGGQIEDYVVIPPNGNSMDPANHWKMYDESIIIEDSLKGTSKKNLYHPVFLDILPIEGLPDTEEENIRHYRRVIFNQKMLGCLVGSWFHGRNLPARIFHLVGRPYAMLRGGQYWVDQIQRIAKSIDFESANYIGVMATTNIHTTEERVKKTEFLPQIEVEFEGHTFKAPAGYDTYLRQLYGADYMMVPPPEKRISHHGFTLYRNVRMK